MKLNREIIFEKLRELIFNKTGMNVTNIIDVRADASDKKIYRIFVRGETYIGVYNEHRSENLAFIKFTDAFIKLGFNVPEEFCYSPDHLTYIVEDLGDSTLFKHTLNPASENLTLYYRQALTDLLKFQILAKDEIDYNFCYQTKEFNSEVISSDLLKFNYHFAKIFPGKKFEDNVIRKIIEFSCSIVAEVRSDYFLYRDFQPRNIMVKDRTLYYIDYQSGRKGPLQYDVASFLYSGSINLSDEEKTFLLKYYIKNLNTYVVQDEEEFTYNFYYFVFLRMLQVLGTYADLHEKRNDKEVLKKIPKALLNLKSLTDKIGNADVRNFIENLTSGIN